MFEKKKAPLVKIPYVTPTVQIYGNIRTITQALTGSGKTDGGNSGGNKTGAT